jgi:hypothetical protein
MLQVVEGTAVLAEDAVAKIVEFERMAKQIKEAEDNLKAAILKEMEEKNILSIDSPELKISYIAATQRESFDAKTFRQDFADLYDEYVKLSPVKASIRITVKK